jgi:ArsR family transcriptional regulator
MLNQKERARVTDPEQQARIFKVLSAGTRVRMIELLKRRPFCVKALARALGVTPAAVSQHLRVLRDAGIVIAEKRGYFVHYRVKAKALAEWDRATRGLWKIDGQTE